MTKDIHKQFSSLCHSRWWEGDLKDVKAFYQLVTEKEVLVDLMNKAYESEELFNLSEELVSLTKLVLLNDPQTKTRLRLHYFKKGYTDTLIHNHKWPLFSNILCGSLDQYFYESTDASPTKMITYHKDDMYLLNPNQYHHLEMDDITITLMLRGPDLLKSSRWFNKETGEHWDHVGGKSDTRKKDLSREMFKSIMEKVKTSLDVNYN